MPLATCGVYNHRIVFLFLCLQQSLEFTRYKASIFFPYPTRNFYAPPLEKLGNILHYIDKPYTSSMGEPLHRPVINFLSRLSCKSNFNASGDIDLNLFSRELVDVTCGIGIYVNIASQSLLLGAFFH